MNEPRDEIKRFPIALQRGRGLQIVLTPDSTKRVHRELAKAGEGSILQFDYNTQEAVICMKRTGTKV